MENMAMKGTSWGSSQHGHSTDIKSEGHMNSYLPVLLEKNSLISPIWFGCSIFQKVSPIQEPSQQNQHWSYTETQVDGYTLEHTGVAEPVSNSHVHLVFHCSSQIWVFFRSIIPWKYTQITSKTLRQKSSNSNEKKKRNTHEIERNICERTNEWLQDKVLTFII